MKNKERDAEESASLSAVVEGETWRVPKRWEKGVKKQK
ncbi:hypothetical protein CHK_1910 [Christensenella hongkongensis]|uniref:Uncharacterized protein n=1 Tax=Christensenella hongkongensis TaxID=270498 RepID=A0A0M2NI34_9FIRM|nr:hypothetical protein CHK_1910 [Christensenella hongkongensis]